MRVSQAFNYTAAPILYRTISYFPDRSGPTSLDGVDANPYDLGGPSFVPLSKKAVLRYTKNLSIGYHHHGSSVSPPAATCDSHVSTVPSALLSSSVKINPLPLPNLDTLHVAGERFCTRRSCPYLSTATPKTVVVDKIDLFSGSPRWTSPFRLPCASTADRVVYLVQSPFFLRRDKWQGLAVESQRVRSSTFIFALREYETEWRDTATRMSDEDAHGALVWHLSTICLMGQGDEKVMMVGLEMVAPHLRPDMSLSSKCPKDVVLAFQAAVSRCVRRRWVDEGVDENVEARLQKCRFMTIREYAAREAREVEVKRELLDKWADCWEHVVASSGLERL